MKKLYSVLFLLLFKFGVGYATPQINTYIERIETAEHEQNLPTVVTTYKELLDNYDKIGGDKEQMPRYMFEYGMYLSYSGEYDKAIGVILKVIELTEGVENQKETRARCSMQLGLIYFFEEQWDTALEHYLRAEKLATEIDNKLGMSIAKNNIGNIYQKKREYDKAIENYNATLELQKTVKDSATICNTLYNLGSCYDQLNNTELTKRYYTESYEIASKINDSEIKSLSLVKLGIMDNNAEWIEQGIDAVKRSGHRQVLAEAYSAYSKLKADEGDYKTAYENAVNARELSDSLFAQESTRQLNDFTVKYRTQEAKAEAAIYKTRLYFTIIVSVLVVLLLTVTYIISHKSNRRLKELNKLKDRFMRIISHDIKNPLMSQKTVLELMVNNIDYLRAEDIKLQCNDLLRSSGSLLNLLHNLLNWSKIESKTLRYNPTNVDICMIVSEMKEDFNIALAQKEVTIESTIKENTIAFADHNMICSVLRNLLYNALKYSHVGGNILVSINSANDKQWRISIKDYGVGMSEETKNRLFKLDTSHSNVGTSGEVGTGMGLVIVKEILAFGGGKIEVDSTEGEGTTISFTIKKGK